MPVEIKEMVIKGIVSKGKAGKKDDPVKSGDNVQYSPAEGQTGGKEDKQLEKPVASLTYGLRKQIVQQCVQEVMDALNRRLDR